MLNFKADFIDTAHKVIVDEASTTVTYIGHADKGTATSSPLWNITRITISGNQTIFELVDGKSEFTKIWDNRASYTYA